MKYYIDGLCSDDIIKDYKIKRQGKDRYKLYIIYLDQASEKNAVKYNLTEKEIIEYQNKLNKIMKHQMEKFILLPNNVKGAKEQEYILLISQILLNMSFLIILYGHKDDAIKSVLDTFLYFLFAYGLKEYSNIKKRESSLSYIEDLEKYRFYLKNYEQLVNIGIYPNMIDYKTLHDLETSLKSFSDDSKGKVNILKC